MLTREQCQDRLKALGVNNKKIDFLFNTNSVVDPNRFLNALNQLDVNQRLNLPDWALTILAGDPVAIIQEINRVQVNSMQTPVFANSPMHLAALSGSVGAVNCLIAMGYKDDPTYIDKQSYNSWDYAILSGSSLVMQFIYANLNLNTIKIMANDLNKWMSLAILSGSLEAVKKLNYLCIRDFNASYDQWEPGFPLSSKESFRNAVRAVLATPSQQFVQEYKEAKKPRPAPQANPIRQALPPVQQLDLSQTEQFKRKSESTRYKRRARNWKIHALLYVLGSIAYLIGAAVTANPLLLIFGVTFGTASLLTYRYSKHLSRRAAMDGDAIPPQDNFNEELTKLNIRSMYRDNFRRQVTNYNRATVGLLVIGITLTIIGLATVNPIVLCMALVPTLSALYTFNKAKYLRMEEEETYRRSGADFIPQQDSSTTVIASLMPRQALASKAQNQQTKEAGYRLSYGLSQQNAAQPRQDEQEAQAGITLRK